MLPCFVVLIALAAPPQPVYQNGAEAYCSGHRMPLPGPLWGAAITPTDMLYGAGDLLCSSNSSWAGCQYLPYAYTGSGKYSMLLDPEGFRMVAARYGSDTYISYAHNIYLEEPHEILHRCPDFRLLAQIANGNYIVQGKTTLAHYNSDTRELLHRMSIPATTGAAWWSGNLYTNSLQTISYSAHQ